MSEKNESFNNIDISEYISILNFISSIPKNHKPCYNSKTTISKSEWFVSIKRRWSSEKGENGILHVNKMLDYFDSMCFDINFDNCKTISIALYNSIIGFDNLIETYNDQETVSKDYIKCKEKALSIYNNIINKINNNNCQLVTVSMSKNSIKSKFFNSNNITFIISKHNTN